MSKVKFVSLFLIALALMATAVLTAKAETKAPDKRVAQAIQYYKKALSRYIRDDRKNGAQCIYRKDAEIIVGELNNFLVKRKMVPVSTGKARLLTNRCVEFNRAQSETWFQRKHNQVCWEDSVEWKCVEQQLQWIIPQVQIQGLKGCAIHDGNSLCWG